MSSLADQYRREAGRLEQMAKSISLLSDRATLLADARSLRQRAEDIESQADGSREIGQTPFPSGLVD